MLFADSGIDWAALNSLMAIAAIILKSMWDQHERSKQNKAIAQNTEVTVDTNKKVNGNIAALVAEHQKASAIIAQAVVDAAEKRDASILRIVEEMHLRADERAALVAAKVVAAAQDKLGVR